MSRLILLLSLLLAVSGVTQSSKLNEKSKLDANPSSEKGRGRDKKIYEFVNGQWFNGRSFTRQTFYSVNGILTNSKPSRIDSAIDLKNGYVMPPFSEAHNHNVGGREGLPALIQTYLRDGIFYVKNPNSIRKQTAEILDLVNTV